MKETTPLSDLAVPAPLTTHLILMWRLWISPFSLGSRHKFDICLIADSILSDIYLLLSSL